MGKLSCDPYIQHFSHHHPLELSNFQQEQTLNFATCSGCKLKPSGWIYTCKPCNYILHFSCSQMPQLINHPADPNHALTLLPSPVYPEGLFNCDACGRQGNGFSYHCRSCSLDIHILCASKPLSLNHQAHPHPLNLSFYPPYQTKGFSCDICGGLGSNHWLYRCNACEFDAHLDCATAKPRSASVQVQPQLQHHNSFPVANQHPQFPQPLQHHHSLPAASHPQFQPPRAAGLGMSTPQRPNYYVNNPSMGGMQGVQPAGNNATGNALMNIAIQGFVDGAAQQVGQNFVQSVMDGGNSNGGDGGGGGGGGGGGDSSTSVFDIGSSVLGNMFGDSSSSDV